MVTSHRSWGLPNEHCAWQQDNELLLVPCYHRDRALAWPFSLPVPSTMVWRVPKLHQAHHFWWTTDAPPLQRLIAASHRRRVLLLDTFIVEECQQIWMCQLPSPEHLLGFDDIVFLPRFVKQVKVTAIQSQSKTRNLVVDFQVYGLIRLWAKHQLVGGLVQISSKLLFVQVPRDMSELHSNFCSGI